MIYIYLSLFILAMAFAITWNAIFYVNRRKTRIEFARFAKMQNLTSALSYKKYDRQAISKIFTNVKKMPVYFLISIFVVLILALISATFLFSSPFWFGICLLIIDASMMFGAICEWMIQMESVRAKVEYNRQHSGEPDIFVPQTAQLISKGWVLILPVLAAISLGIDIFLLFMSIPY